MAYPMLARRAYGATGDGATLGRPKWLGGGCHGLHSSSGMPRVEVNRTLCKVLALADAVTFAYLSRHGVVQAPRQTADRPSSAHSHREGARSWTKVVFPFQHSFAWRRCSAAHGLLTASRLDCSSAIISTIMAPPLPA